ncbi:aldehyde dehydrogenase (NADP(+)) [Flaviaesturariibacter flavus]|uniref:Aldehyde dehydrogenase (NADP(+)) n=1 Tax=Flaviaesturariibacter flavus TaxID=2502780 RepID=A0A4R1B9X5_9BACT|nr:aldehyde dehydrogenase (NADP(+)) [Flaviaesturariibacter flavus]TCJ13741.1 aldehyde dehydrogenase (NADP(+)) [Flaviaesturariibacter flavus]
MNDLQARIDKVLQQATRTALAYAQRTLEERSAFLSAIAEELEKRSDVLIDTAAGETHLAPERLRTELQRTQWQLYSYGQACREGDWLDIRIDIPDGAGTENPGNGDAPSWTVHRRQNDLRKMLLPLGPVVVFGASNFPFAYSTAGGDTACALAAGCPVIVKAHPAHAATSRLVAEAVQESARRLGLPEGVFQHVEGGFDEGQALVLHPHTRAVGFTGSLEGGRALFDLAQQRPVPIPVFAEMGSVNPVFLLPEGLAADAEGFAKQFLQSVTGSAGQFCTKPGLLVGIDSPALDSFREYLSENIGLVPPQEMLHPGIAKAFQHKRADALAVESVAVAGTLSCPVGRNDSIPTLAETDAAAFLANPVLHHEVFGPFALLVRCADGGELLSVAEALEGQITCTLVATTDELRHCPQLITALQARCGRFIRNGVPTGVEVVPAMMHGGPYPATTDSRFTAVGADGIRRFARPVCYQNWENELLPAELQNENPLGIWRTVNGVLSRDALGNN